MTDMVGQKPIHYAALFKQANVFKFLLDNLLSQNKVQNNQTNLFAQVNSGSMEMTIASYCIVNQSWHCFAELINTVGQSIALESQVNLEL